VFSADNYRQQAAEVAARGRWPEAERLLSIAIGLDPHDASSRDDRGVLFSGQGRWPEAMQEFDAALSIDPRMAEAWLHRAEAHAKVGERAEALRDATTSEGLAAKGSPLAKRAAGLAAVLVAR
jgi:tetratricopeptide (TPR) repeat protein